MNRTVKTALRAGTVAALSAAAIAQGPLAGAATSGFGKTAYVRDKVGDAPKQIDIKSVFFAHNRATGMYYAKLHIRNLRYRGDFSFQFSLDDYDDGYGEADVQAHSATHTATFTMGWYNREGYHKVSSRGAHFTFQPSKGTVWMAVPVKNIPSSVRQDVRVSSMVAENTMSAPHGGVLWDDSKQVVL